MLLDAIDTSSPRTAGNQTAARPAACHYPALRHAGRTLAVRREPPRSGGIERYLHRWFTDPPSVLVTLASDSELQSRNADYPTLSCTSQRFGDIAYSTYLLAQNVSPMDGIRIRTGVVSLTHGSGIVTFPAVQAWTRDGHPIIHADALAYLHQVTERLRTDTPAQHTRRSSVYHVETRPLKSICLAVQATHRSARLGMWLATAALYERGNVSLDSVLRDIRIGTLTFDPTFGQYQELSRFAKARHRRCHCAERDVMVSPVPLTSAASRFAPPSIDSPPTPRTLHDARSSPLS